MIDYRKARDWQSGDVRHAYTPRDTMLYALGLGLGADPLDEKQLRFVYEKELAALPTMAAVLASPGFWMRERKEIGIDFMKLVHGEQAVRLHAPLPPSGTVVGRTRVTRLVDKGAGKGAILHAEKELVDGDGRALATVESVYFLRGDGGFSAADGQCDEPAPALPAEHPAADAAPQLTLDLPTRPDQALLYRLSGDMNPLHAEPAFAAKVGFARPILHGLATWGMAGRGLLAAYADSDPARLRAMRARFSAPVYPGETLRLESWRDGTGVAFRLRALERDVLVLTHGRAELL
ncbi:Acyl dehydratase [Variovorax sp. OK605]|uniref:MaoC/PaaZ C-terminal domain-containing protein n=1 Tax=Variovorax sp. OK605 TaxID=1855317 RepID=UPI0008E897FA|nr:MaoC/PaaZ C-terminal domain-containing protein [Variovorax sp. OK605]SFQ53117.1 Acyl dehydratase [Variovorax sp. OK605]